MSIFASVNLAALTIFRLARSQFSHRNNLREARAHWHPYVAKPLRPDVSFLCLKHAR